MSCRCSNCGTKEKKLMRCERCRTARYCSKECQKKHWKVHKKRCKKKKIVLPDTLSTKKNLFVNHKNVNYGKSLGKSSTYKSKSLKTLLITVYVYDNDIEYIKDSDVKNEFFNVDSSLCLQYCNQISGYENISKKSSKEIKINNSKRVEHVKFLISEYVITTKKEISNPFGRGGVLTRKKSRSGEERSYLYLTAVNHYFVKIRVSFEEEYFKNPEYLNVVNDFVEQLVKNII